MRLTVAEASFLPLLKNSGGGVFAGLRSGGPGGGEKPKVVIPSVNLSQQAQKLARARVGAGEKRLASHPFVAVTLERPRPWQGLLIGHTNTEYATQAPMAAAAPQEQQAFLFYAPQIDVGQAHLRFELFHETSTSAAARIRLDSRYTKFGSVADHPDASKDVEAWLPLLDRDGQPTGRLLVRVGLFASASTVGSTTASSTSSIYGSGVGGGPVDLISFDGQEAALSPPAAPVPTLSPTPSDAVASADHAAAANRRACYEWTRQAGFSGKAPRECDVFTGAGATGGTERVHVRYPLDWLKQHIDSLAKDLSVLQSALRLSEQAAAEGRGFRSSEHKVTPELQGVATNVHSQTFVLADMGALLAAGVGAGALADGAAATATAAAAGAKFHVYDLVSAGAPTAHALGFHAGGLVSQQQAMARLQREMAALDQQIQGLVGAQGTYVYAYEGARLDDDDVHAECIGIGKTHVDSLPSTHHHRPVPPHGQRRGALPAAAGQAADVRGHARQDDRPPHPVRIAGPRHRHDLLGDQAGRHAHGTRGPDAGGAHGGRNGEGRLPGLLPGAHLHDRQGARECSECVVTVPVFHSIISPY